MHGLKISLSLGKDHIRAFQQPSRSLSHVLQRRSRHATAVICNICNTVQPNLCGVLPGGVVQRVLSAHQNCNGKGREPSGKLFDHQTVADHLTAVVRHIDQAAGLLQIGKKGFPRFLIQLFSGRPVQKRKQRFLLHRARHTEINVIGRSCVQHGCMQTFSLFLLFYLLLQIRHQRKHQSVKFLLDLRIVLGRPENFFIYPVDPIHQYRGRIRRGSLRNHSGHTAQIIALLSVRSNSSDPFLLPVHHTADTGCAQFHNYLFSSPPQAAF